MGIFTQKYFSLLKLHKNDQKWGFFFQLSLVVPSGHTIQGKCLELLPSLNLEPCVSFCAIVASYVTSGWIRPGGSGRADFLHLHSRPLLLLGVHSSSEHRGVKYKKKMIKRGVEILSLQSPLMILYQTFI